MKKRVLSGIQPSGKLHIGNYFGMIKRMVEYQESSDLFLMVVNMHSLTTIQDKDELEKMTLDVAIDLLALGINPNKCHFWVQSDIPEVTELTWVLSCLTPMGLMQRAHSFKDKTAKGIEASLGLFSYPSLMAADILINQSEVIPVGKDQKQHLEMARDMAQKFNLRFGETFVVPEADIAEDAAVVPGIDGQKMSKSYKNTIPIFAEDKVWKKAIMSIVTDSKGVDEPKNPENCNVYGLYKLFTTPEERVGMAEDYRKGNIGYGDAKKELLKKVIDTFGPMKERRKHFEENPEEVRAILKKGAEKVRKISLKTMEEVRKKVGFKY